MPHSRPGKRERLVASAGDLLHRQGVARTTLAEVAGAADVPPGNVYYYFKTRDELIRAVIDCRAEEVGSLFAELELRPDPRERLKALTHSWADLGPLIADHGCPLGSLALELNKDGSALGTAAGDLFRLLLDWSEAQFRALGHDDARALATTLIAGIQGAALLANALHDVELIAGETARLERWIDAVA